MSDEAFHLTPIDIRRYDFGSALRGYDKARVDQFRDQVAAEVERQLAEIETAEATPLPQVPMGTTNPQPQRGDEPKRTAHPTPAWLDSLVKE